ncbi:hypothetical protein ACFYNO_28535 [Kitasatospora sp. NPDC006697]|uniref:hypothetical protein n=1 Tax=Kitasatospora sp. NPDC006697 TaxID=3364020 RepID=UPI0036CE4B41
MNHGRRLGEDPGLVDQVVFRRQGGDLIPAAASFHREDAELLARQLTPLLRAEDGGRQPSLVRCRTASGAAALIQRWPALDPDGHPGTISHALIGPVAALSMGTCVSLHELTLRGRDFAARATGRLTAVPVGELREAARRQLPGEDELRAVEPVLAAATAALLTDPRRPLALLGSSLPDWPERNPTALVAFGLRGITFNWLNRFWSFATYDTAPRLWVTAVPEPPGGAAHLVDLAAPAGERADELAAALVARFLDRLPDGTEGLVLAHCPGTADAPLTDRLDALAHRLQATAQHRPAPEPPVERGLLDTVLAAGGDAHAAWDALTVLHTRPRSDRLAAELCAHLLRHRLYLRLDLPDEDDALRAAWLFDWAVSPLVRDPAQQPGLSGLLHELARHGSAHTRALLERLVLDTPPGVAPPDLPPVLWQQLLRDLRDLGPAPVEPAEEPVEEPADEPAGKPVPAFQAPSFQPLKPHQPPERDQRWLAIALFAALGTLLVLLLMALN